MAFDVNNFVIDHALRGIMFSNGDDGAYMWSINQITDPTLNITSETEQAVDALGTPIATFNRGKEAEFSAENSLFDLGLFAAQNGRDKEIAGSDATITTPVFETIKATGSSSAIVLAHTPTKAVTEIYALNGDGTFGTAYTSSTTAEDGTFIYNESAHSITLSADIAKGTEFMVVYEYEAEEAVAVTGTAVDFPKAGKFILEVLGADVCDTTNLIHAYIVFPNAKLDAEVDISFTTDGTHPFTIQAQQAYCDSEKVLFKVIIPNEE